MIETDVYKHIRYGDLSDELKLINEGKCIVYIWSLVQLLGEKCRETSCSAAIQESHVTACGFCIKITWKCINGHPGIWYSSPIYGSGFGINYLVNTALLVSGGNVTQFHRFCDFLNLCRESQDSFYRYMYGLILFTPYTDQSHDSFTCHRNQRYYAAPAINQMYKERQREIVSTFQGRQLVLCGDTRMDSPGFSAMKATYTFMEHDSNVVLHMEHGDKRQVQCVCTIYGI